MFFFLILCVRYHDWGFPQVARDFPKSCPLKSLPKKSKVAFQLHHAVHNMSKKPLGLFWQFRPSTRNNNDTLYYYLLQDLSIRHKTRDRAERQFTQLLLSERRPEKTCRKKTRGEKSRQEIWVGTMAQTLNSPSYEAKNLKRVYPR